MGDTGIEWTDETWNPIRGCRRTAHARDPKECVAITAEEACVLFDRACELENDVKRTRFEAAQEIDLLKRDRDERLAACMRGEQHQRERNADLVTLLAETEARLHAAEGALADATKRLDILRSAYEAETGKACRI